MAGLATGVLAAFALSAVVVSNALVINTELAQASSKMALPVRIAHACNLVVLRAIASRADRLEGLWNSSKPATLSREQAVPGLATKPADQAETKKLFAYLSADSYTPEVRPCPLGHVRKCRLANTYQRHIVRVHVPVAVSW